MTPIRELCRALVCLCLNCARYNVAEHFEREELFWLGPNSATVTIEIGPRKEREVHGR